MQPWVILPASVVTDLWPNDLLQPGLHWIGPGLLSSEGVKPDYLRIAGTKSFSWLALHQQLTY